MRIQLKRKEFYKPEEILMAVQDKIRKAEDAGRNIDYLTFVPDGEPTLDINLGRSIRLLKRFNIPIAIISNNSLIWQEGVRNDLMEADWVSLKMDTVDEEKWHNINRPNNRLNLSSILEGALEFARYFKGKLATETMLIKGINDDEQSINKLANFLAVLDPDVAYLSIPIRPPAEITAQAPEEYIVNQAYQIIHKKIKSLEYLTGYEGNAFASTGEVKDDILSITSVHPMRKDALQEFLRQANSSWVEVQQLLDQNKLVEIPYKGHKFYLRKFLTPATAK